MRLLKKDLILKNRTAVTEKIKESARSVLPIVIIVTLLCFSIAPINTDLMLNFFIGTMMVVIGIGLFSLGADTSMIKIGNKIGTALTKKLPLIVLVSFAFGFAVTIAEPAVTVLESNEKRVLLSVADNEKLKKFIKEQKKKCLSLYRVTELSYLCR